MKRRALLQSFIGLFTALKVMPTTTADPPCVVKSPGKAAITFDQNGDATFTGDLIYGDGQILDLYSIGQFEIRILE